MGIRIHVRGITKWGRRDCVTAHALRTYCARTVSSSPRRHSPSVPIRMIRPGIRVVVGGTSTISGSRRIIPNTHRLGHKTLCDAQKQFGQAARSSRTHFGPLKSGWISLLKDGEWRGARLSSGLGPLLASSPVRVPALRTTDGPEAEPPRRVPAIVPSCQCATGFFMYFSLGLAVSLFMAILPTSLALLSPSCCGGAAPSRQAPRGPRLPGRPSNDDGWS